MCTLPFEKLVPYLLRIPADVLAPAVLLPAVAVLDIDTVLTVSTTVPATPRFARPPADVLGFVARAWSALTPAPPLRSRKRRRQEREGEQDTPPRKRGRGGDLEAFTTPVQDKRRRGSTLELNVLSPMSSNKVPRLRLQLSD